MREEVRTLNDFEVLDSDTAAAEAAIIVRGRLVVHLTGGYSREERVSRPAVRGSSLSAGLAVRF